MPTRTFEAEIAALRPLTEWSRAVCAGLGLPGQAADDLEVCLDEAVSNVVHHGQLPVDRRTFTVDLAPSDGGVRVTVIDEGVAFNPLEVAEPPAPTGLDDLTIGGYGIVILRRLAHDLTYERRDGRNVLGFRVGPGRTD